MVLNHETYRTLWIRKFFCYGFSLKDMDILGYFFIFVQVGLLRVYPFQLQFLNHKRVASRYRTFIASNWRLGVEECEEKGLSEKGQLPALLQAHGAESPLDFVSSTISRIKLAELEETLLVLPLDVVKVPTRRCELNYSEVFRIRLHFLRIRIQIFFPIRIWIPIGFQFGSRQKTHFFKSNNKKFWEIFVFNQNSGYRI